MTRAGPQRILVIGNSGAGKTTLSRRLARAQGLPFVNLDREYWRPGWTPTPEDEWLKRVRELVAEPRWVMDGNFRGSLSIRLPRAELVIRFQTSRWSCLWGVASRWVAHHGRVRPEMAPGCPERLDLAFLRYVWSFPRDFDPSLDEALSDHFTGGPVELIRSRDEAAAVGRRFGIPA